MEDLILSINGTSINPTRFEGKVRQFSVEVDEPENFGGKGSAPTPVEYILAGYAGCLNVVVNLIAKEMGISTKSLEINITGDINPEKLLGISDKERCPVNDNLANTTPVNYSN